MTRVWLSPGLPADRDAVAAELGPGYEMLPASADPPAATVVPPVGTAPDDTAETPSDGGGTAVEETPNGPAPAGPPADHPPAEPTILVVAAFEADLLRRLSGRPREQLLVVVTPPGGDLPAELRQASQPQLIGPASTVADVVALIRAAPTHTAMLAWAGTPWGRHPAATGAAVGAAAAAGAPGRAARLRRRFGRRRTLLVAGIVAALLAAGGSTLGVALAGDDNDSRPIAAKVVGPDADRYHHWLPYGGPPFFGPRGWSAEDRREFNQCMKDHGVDLDDKNLWNEPPGTLDQKVRDALRECLPHLYGRPGKDLAPA
jgi:hypothetical protein